MLVYIEGVSDQISIQPRYFFIYLYCYCHHHNSRVYVLIIGRIADNWTFAGGWCCLYPTDAAFYSYMKQLSGYWQGWHGLSQTVLKSV